MIGREAENQGSKKSWFSNLGKSTTEHIHQLIAENERELLPMKWENFLKVSCMVAIVTSLLKRSHKVMREMGFSYDPATAGHSMRFDPPDPRDRSITILKCEIVSQNLTVRELTSPRSRLKPSQIKRNWKAAEEVFRMV